MGEETLPSKTLSKIKTKEKKNAFLALHFFFFFIAQDRTLGEIKKDLDHTY